MWSYALRLRVFLDQLFTEHTWLQSPTWVVEEWVVAWAGRKGSKRGQAAPYTNFQPILQISARHLTFRLPETICSYTVTTAFFLAAILLSIFSTKSVTTQTCTFFHLAKFCWHFLLFCGQLSRFFLSFWVYAFLNSFILNFERRAEKNACVQHALLITNHRSLSDFK